MSKTSNLHVGAAFVTVTFGIVLSALVLRSRVEAITCYDCNSEYDPRCGDPFDPYTLGQIDCNERHPLEHLPGSNATLCRKLVQKVGTKIRVIRTCGYIEEAGRDDKACVSRSGTHDVNVLYCSCKSSLCNAGPPAPRLSSMELLMLPVVIVVARLMPHLAPRAHS